MIHDNDMTFGGSVSSAHLNGISTLPVNLLDDPANSDTGRNANGNPRNSTGIGTSSASIRRSGSNGFNNSPVETGSNLDGMVPESEAPPTIGQSSINRQSRRLADRSGTGIPVRTPRTGDSSALKQITVYASPRSETQDMERQETDSNPTNN